MERILQKLSTYPQVEAIAIGGSRAMNYYDASSDYDVYIYLKGELPIESRRALLEEQCSRLELGNHYWELEDNGTLKDGSDFDFVYRNFTDFENNIKDVVIYHHPRNSYTTCFWYNLLTCRIVFEQNEVLSEMKKRYDVLYPEELRKAIIQNNLHLLHGCLPSYDAQIKKASIRGDQVSVNHRVAEFLAAYFDLLFAYNRVLHPGEKRMREMAAKQCKKLPEHFQENLEWLFQTMFTKDIMQAVDAIVSSVVKLCKEEMDSYETVEKRIKYH